MVSLNLHLRQELGEWVVTAVLIQTYGNGVPPDKSVAEYRYPLTEQEWDEDVLSSVLSAVARWSGMTMEDERAKH